MKFTQIKTEAQSEILYNNHYVGMPIMVSNSGITPNSQGKKIVKAGTIYPSNDDSVLGVILHDTDVTHGDAPGTLVIHGFINNTKLAQNGVTVSNAAKEALKLVEFIGGN